MTEKGPYGEATKLTVPDIPQAAETLCAWLITAPSYHPAWCQYVLSVVRLRDLEGWPVPKRDFDGASHELIVLALDPSGGDLHTPETLAFFFESGTLPYLTPVNIVQQHEATDEEMDELARLACFAVVHGALCPETADAPELVRENWLASATKTLAHIRGEEHAP